MAHKELKQWIATQLQDPEWGSHQEVQLPNSRLKPDWFYQYPNKKAIIIEDKEENDASLDAATQKIKKYEKVLNDAGFNDVIKIVVKDTGTDKLVKVWRNNKFISSVLETLVYYETLLGARKITDISDEIFKYTASINQILNDEFNISILKHRMLFTGCILLAAKYGDGKFEDYGGVDAFKQLVSNKIFSLYPKNDERFGKVNELVDEFNKISVGRKPTKAVIDNICDICNKINKILKENPQSDIDIMNIFFTEFNRYRGPSQNGQVFTPDHIADLMSLLINVNENDKILDPTCGSGSLLIKAAKYNGGNWRSIYGNDNDIHVLVLAYINMLLHKDGVTNLRQYNAIIDEDYIKWIKQSKITKVVANPPYENDFAISILENVLDNVSSGCKICWLMPNNKFDKKASTKRKTKIFAKNTLTDIVLLPDIFAKTSCGQVSLFLFTKGIPQGKTKIKCWSIPDDGFITVKNQGYKDVHGKWPKIKQEFLEKFKQNKYDLLIEPKGSLSYPKKNIVNRITRDDFILTKFQYELFVNPSNVKYELLGNFMSLNNKDDKINFLKNILGLNDQDFLLKFKNSLPNLKAIDVSTWKPFPVGKIIHRHVINSISSHIRKYVDGSMPVVTNTAINNGIKKYLNVDDPTYIHKGNSLSYGAKGGLFFYQKKEWASTDHVHMFTSEHLNENTALFLCAVLNNLVKSLGGWESGLEKKILDEEILLPVNKQGEADWEFMNKYMENKKA